MLRGYSPIIFRQSFACYTSFKDRPRALVQRTVQRKVLCDKFAWFVLCLLRKKQKQILSLYCPDPIKAIVHPLLQRLALSPHTWTYFPLMSYR